MVMSVALSSLKRRCLVALLDSKFGFCIDLRLMSQNNRGYQYFLHSLRISMWKCILYAEVISLHREGVENAQENYTLS